MRASADAPGTAPALSAHCRYTPSGGTYGHATRSSCHRAKAHGTSAFSLEAAPGVNAAKLESHLSEAQFAEVLGMGRGDFYSLSKMEQMRIKQDVGLF